MRKVLTTRQFEILNILWEADRALLVSEIAESHQLHVNTVQAAIKKLIKIGYVEVADIVHSRNVLARTYKPVITKDDYLELISQEMGKPGFSEQSLVALVKKEDNIEVLHEIEQIIREKLQE